MRNFSPRPWDTLRVIREKDGHSQHSLAAVSGLSQATISLLESGRRRATPQIRLKLSRALNIPVSLLEPRADELTEAEARELLERIRNAQDEEGDAA
ncbi:helix-turn-helix domain-containing protein [Saccharopolyspora sp. 6T]|uniref:helix-turn-helix domain-containing protein n=1 Tax=Saccharopolyspora sp. 6T TaxID=2877238 RepID=UPI001CD6F6BA|nr:helix-turn-helix transcriptional regulator [Saccharopolyspora sp. 6T]MCA1185795.1 helix-turn-helix domain-containing protein [Saccharopolyspora sp. 6T]